MTAPSTPSVDERIAEIIRDNGYPRVDSPPDLRWRMAEEIARVTRERFPGREVPDSARLQELRREGISSLGSEFLDPKQMDEIRDHLLRVPVYNAHVPQFSDGVARPIGRRRLLLKPNPRSARRFPFGSYLLGDLLACPHLLEACLRPEVLMAAEGYLHCLPTLFSVHCWWTFVPNEFRADTTTHYWHRDPDDYRFCTLFIFLSDIDESGGQHLYVRRSHDPELMEARMKEMGLPASFPWDDHTAHPKEHPFYEANTLSCTGRRGTAFLADTYGIHRAVAPRRDRLMAWARYGYFANRSYVADGTQPVAAESVADRIEFTDEIRHVTRLLIR